MAQLGWFILFALTAFAQPTTGLIGRWRSVETSKGGIGMIFEFHDAGILDFSSGAVVELKYRIEGNELILPPATTNGPEQRQTMEWQPADRLILKGADTLSRQGPARDANRPILGEWTARREMDGVALQVRYLFDGEGNCLFLLPFKWQKGGYSVKGATMRVQYPGQAPVEGPFRIEGDMLTIPRASGKGETRLRRY